MLLPSALTRPILAGLVFAGIASGCVIQTNTPPTGSSGPSVQAPDGRSGWPAKLVLGLFGGDDSEATLKSNAPLADYLSRELNIPVEFFSGTSYTAVIEAMRAKRVDGMSVGPFSYLLAVQEAKAEALAINVSTRAEPALYDPRIRPSYFSVLFTKKGSGINSIEDLRGRSFNFVDPASTSGHLVPRTILLKRGINPDKEMRTVFAGSHPTSALAVWNGKSDAGASTETTLYNLRDSNQIEFCGFPDNEVGIDRTAKQVQDLFNSCPEGKIAMITLSEPIPNTPFAVRADLPDSLKAAIKKALLATKDNPELIRVLKRWYVDPHQAAGVPTLDAYYNPLRDIAKMLQLDLKELVAQGG